MENTTTENTKTNCKKEEITDCTPLKESYLECLNNFLLESNTDCCTELFKNYTSCDKMEANQNKYSK